MKTVLFYFSATGNTEYGTKLIKAGIETNSGSECECVELKNYSPEALKTSDLIGFASPVFAYKPALNMLAFIESLPPGEGRPCFTFVSYAGDLSNVHWIFKRRLEAKGYRVIAQGHMLAQGSWTTSRAPGRLEYEHEPSPATQASTIAFSEKLPAAFRECKAGTLHFQEPAFRPLLTHVVSYFYNDTVLRNLFVTKVDEKACNRCGACVRGCPTGRMSFDRFPKPKGTCVGCYRCINLCPKNAIEGWFTKGNSRYKGLAPAITSLLDITSGKAKL